MTDGFFALVDDHGWSMAPRIPARMQPRLPAVGGVHIWGFEADEPVSFAAPVEQPRRPVPVRLPRRHWWSRSLVVRAPLPLVPLVRVGFFGFFDLRGRLLLASPWLPYRPTDTIRVSDVKVTAPPDG